MKNSSGQNKTEISLKHEIAALKKQLYELEDSNKNAISKNEYYSIYHNVPVGIMHFDEKGILLDCNDAFVDMIGSSREELIGLDMINQLSDNDLIDALKLSLQSGEGRYEDIYKSISAHKETPARILFKGLRNEKNKYMAEFVLLKT